MDGDAAFWNDVQSSVNTALHASPSPATQLATNPMIPSPSKRPKTQSQSLASFFAPAKNKTELPGLPELKPSFSQKQPTTDSGLSPLQRNVIEIVRTYGPIHRDTIIAVLLGNASGLTQHEAVQFKKNALYGRLKSKKTQQDVRYVINNLVGLEYLQTLPQNLIDIRPGGMPATHGATGQTTSRSTPSRASTPTVKLESEESNGVELEIEIENSNSTPPSQIQALLKGSASQATLERSSSLTATASSSAPLPALPVLQVHDELMEFDDPVAEKAEEKEDDDNNEMNTEGELLQPRRILLRATSPLGTDSKQRAKLGPQKALEPPSSMVPMVKPKANMIVNNLPGAKPDFALSSYSSKTQVGATAGSTKPSGPSLANLSKFTFQPVSHMNGPSPAALSENARLTMNNVKKRKVMSSSAEADIENMALSGEQKEVMRFALTGRSFFFTGAAGCGKSHLMRQLVAMLRKSHDYSEIQVTAPTGIAACNINGCTLHSFGGVGLGKDPVDKLVRKILANSQARNRWRDTKVLVIDEISMLSGDLFAKLEEIGRKLRKNSLPFGGIQVIACGDFFQLPPVGEGNQALPFCFETPAWTRVMGKSFILKQIWRQKEMGFINLLNEIRIGQLSPQGRAMLQSCVKRQFPNDGIAPTILHPRKDDVERQNEGFLNRLATEMRKYPAKDGSKYENSSHLDALQKNCPAPTMVTLRVGAQVILLKNLDVEGELVNGSRGKIVAFQEDKETKEILPLVEFENGRRRIINYEKWSTMVGADEVAWREQVPLQLAWSLSIHKSQGMTISRVEIGLGRIFEDGQAYVALSRATSLEGLRIQGNVDPKVIRANPKVLQFYQQLEEQYNPAVSNQ